MSLSPAAAAIAAAPRGVGIESMSSRCVTSLHSSCQCHVTYCSASNRSPPPIYLIPKDLQREIRRIDLPPAWLVGPYQLCTQIYIYFIHSDQAVCKVCYVFFVSSFISFSSY
jgi:hypothetical protein